MTYVAVLKWLCLSLFSYVATVLVVHVPWHEAVFGLLMPSIVPRADYMTALVAVLGRMISPYLFFWQAQLEVEEDGNAPNFMQASRSRADALALK
jgi:Mn2+/Fe2+ NRAMP family transporter